MELLLKAIAGSHTSNDVDTMQPLSNDTTCAINNSVTCKLWAFVRRWMSLFIQIADISPSYEERTRNIHINLSKKRNMEEWKGAHGTQEDGISNDERTLHKFLRENAQNKCVTSDNK